MSANKVHITASFDGKTVEWTTDEDGKHTPVEAHTPTSGNEERIMLYRPKDARGEPWGFYRPTRKKPLPDDWESAVFVRVA